MRWDILLAITSASLAGLVGVIAGAVAQQQVEAQVSITAVTFAGMLIALFCTPIAVLFRTAESKNKEIVKAKDESIDDLQAQLARAEKRADLATIYAQQKDAETVRLVTDLIRSTEAGMGRMATSIDQNTRTTEDRNRLASAEHAQQNSYLADLVVMRLSGTTVTPRQQTDGRRSPETA